ncbi:Rv3654c family TadE-like protein [Ornithinimicrobium cryptoxanthini]|uniref:Helicase/secretion neighborhood TadE-like protein n=1 Tax=Ornithinimicrobium cryptoxanthini TaxID=2934161 RepID=A0ABY4YIS1_9MICO|nr:Rv3654c family TadE-like protein [Ornithinimicrobium cryptoxanthini]USQ76691.1 hypothetical protein NF557_01795 [Ornithinimicrobium cryptoxanthini]
MRGAAEARRALAPRGRAPRDRGSATVLAVGAVLLLVSVLVAFLLVGAAAQGSLRARAAADAAALAGAGVLLEGGSMDAACAAAVDLAAANGARVLSCDARQVASSGPALRVAVVVAVPALSGAEAHAVAHAGLVTKAGG